MENLAHREAGLIVRVVVSAVIADIFSFTCAAPHSGVLIMLINPNPNPSHSAPKTRNIIGAQREL